MQESYTMRYQSYFNTALLLVGSYDGSVPLVHYLKQYFAQHKKHGSKDRRLISHLCYCYYRLGHTIREVAVEERLKAALFLCSEEAGVWEPLYEAEWKKAWHDSPLMRMAFVKKCYPSFGTETIFPWQAELSEDIDAALFATSHLVQPDLFLRIRPGYADKVRQVLAANRISFREPRPGCLALANGSKTDALLAIDKEVVIQDYSSQRVAALLERIPHPSQQTLKLWDCCAASGGKSLLAIDTLGKMELMVSDIRSSILQNLRDRFQKAGVKKYSSEVIDLSDPAFAIHHSPFTVILCDAPCSGSGTWGRTPEQLYFFTADKIEAYAVLQRKILLNVLPHVAKNGYLLYITCSVFRKENEEQVNWLVQQGEFEMVAMELLKGYDIKADTMFAALLRKKV